MPCPHGYPRCNAANACCSTTESYICVDAYFDAIAEHSVSRDVTVPAEEERLKVIEYVGVRSGQGHYFASSAAADDADIAPPRGARKYFEGAEPTAPNPYTYADADNADLDMPMVERPSAPTVPGDQCLPYITNRDLGDEHASAVKMLREQRVTTAVGYFFPLMLVGETPEPKKAFVTERYRIERVIGPDSVEHVITKEHLHFDDEGKLTNWLPAERNTPPPVYRSLYGTSARRAARERQE